MRTSRALPRFQTSKTSRTNDRDAPTPARTAASSPRSTRSSIPAARPPRSLARSILESTSGHLRSAGRSVAAAALGAFLLAGAPVHGAPLDRLDRTIAATSVETAKPARTLSREELHDRLVGLWLAQCIANWTGLQTEFQKEEAPFYTDADWGTNQGRGVEGSAGRKITFNFQSPWGADDDTDIEYIYLDAMVAKGSAMLSPDEIAKAWKKHIEPGEFIWVANDAADKLMRGSPAVLPPSTSLFAANDQSLMIDAQLTTELFGALAPGLPRRALELADLPISTTASGYAAHAAQFHVALYSLAPVADPALSAKEKVLWMVEKARRLIPDSSKTADVIDFVLADYRANPDVGDWERTRDRVAKRFQDEAEQHGYLYTEAYESSVNLATGLIALLYGEGDFKRTVQIGTLSGWDSDNGTATMGGLLGLLYGAKAIRVEFPEQALSSDFRISRTRVGFAPGTVSFDRIADQMIELIGKTVTEQGGAVSSGGAVTIPAIDLDALDPAVDNPRMRLHHQSANNAAAERHVEISGGRELRKLRSAGDEALADGLEVDFSGIDRKLEARWDLKEPAEPRCVARSGAGSGSGRDPITMQVIWDRAMPLAGIRFVEGASTKTGGGWEDARFEARVGGAWIPAPLRSPFVSNPALAFEIHDLAFTEPVTADGIRIVGRASGRERWVTACELDGILTR